MKGLAAVAVIVLLFVNPGLILGLLGAGFLLSLVYVLFVSIFGSKHDPELKGEVREGFRAVGGEMKEAWDQGWQDRKDRKNRNQN